MNVQEHETFCEPGLENIRNSEECWDDVTHRVEETQQELGDDEMMFRKTFHDLFTPADPQTALHTWRTANTAGSHTHTDHFILQICDITSRQRLNDSVSSVAWWSFMELHVLTEDVLHGAVHSEGEQRFRKFSEERLQDHSGNVDVSVLIKVHRFTCTRSNETNLYWHADINTNTVRRFLMFYYRRFIIKGAVHWKPV